MSGAQLNADGRLGLMLTELRLPTMKRLATELCDQSDREGWPARQLLERLLEQEMNEREVRRFERHRIASGILDDLSYVRRDQAETSVLFELIAERYERKSIAITANTPFSQWSDVFVDPAMTIAAIDRLVHHATILEMNAESYRRRSAQKQQTRQAGAAKT
jgi:DNA replication protein DnaC